MSSVAFYILIAFYVALLFVVAYFTIRIRKTYKWLHKQSWVYALSLVLYCTAWTFYGSIGNAAQGGFSYIGVYLGPTLLAPLWGLVLVKMIQISKQQRITSIADFISSRYGRSSRLGMLISLFSVVIIIPYISIQLKALTFSSSIITHSPTQLPAEASSLFYKDPAFLFAMAFALFTTVFGTIKLDPNEKHPGLVHTIAFESIIKLIAFLVGAIVIIWSIGGGFLQVFQRIQEHHGLTQFYSVGDEHLPYSTWITIAFLSGLAFLILPRQFHIAVVENRNIQHIKTAAWLTPLYLFLISLFVIPIAGSGQLLLSENIESDTYLLQLPLAYGYNLVGVLVFIGGLAAASGMMIVSLLSLSIMVSNNVLLPLLLKFQKQFDYFLNDLNKRLLELRRVVIFVVALLAYGFYQVITVNFSLVSVGLISFAGVAQFAPAFFLGMYWKNATATGAKTGLILGMLTWAFTLPFGELLAMGYFNPEWLEHGFLSISLLRPRALLGLEGLDPITHSVFWSLSINILTFVWVSLRTQPSSLELIQADVFLHPEKYQKYRASQLSPVRREANFMALDRVLKDILSPEKVQSIYQGFFGSKITTPLPEKASSELIDYVETYLSGAIGAASTKIVLDYIVIQKALNVDDLMNMLNQTQQVMEYSRALQDKTQKLDLSSRELKKANERLLELDMMKNEFISNVTHELRTPLTSIRSLAQTMDKYEVSTEEQQRFIQIIQQEAERMSSLINQVLDLRKTESRAHLMISEFEAPALIQEVFDLLAIQKGQRQWETRCEAFILKADRGKLKQILINLIGNALKFTEEDGHILVEVSEDDKSYTMKVVDDGLGMKEEDSRYIFDRFYQINPDRINKPAGSGLGLSICRKYMELMSGTIDVDSTPGQGSTFIMQWPKDLAS